MLEIPSRSKKLQKDYFLKCPDCATVMFYNGRRKTWEPPVTKKEEPSRSPSARAESARSRKVRGAVKTVSGRATAGGTYPCPVCGEKLIEREYEREGKKKRMLVCSSPTARTDGKHGDVVYFESRNRFWSKKYGEIPLE